MPESILNQFKEANNIDTPEKTLQKRYAPVNIMDKYNPYRLLEDSEPYQGGYPFIFMTTPSMNIFDGETIQKSLAVSAPAFLDEFSLGNRDILYALQYGSNSNKTSTFIKFLTNRFKSLTTKDFSMRSIDRFESYKGFKQVLPGPNAEGITADVLSVNFTESKDLDVIKFNLLWMRYMEAVRFGTHKPNNGAIYGKFLDYTSSIYYFILDADLSKILYYCKYTGVYPVMVPLGNMGQSIQDRTIQDVSISYQYMVKEDLDPQILTDFNLVSKTPSKLVNVSGEADIDSSDLLRGIFSNKSILNPEGVNSKSKPIDFLSERSFDSVQIVKKKSYDNENKSYYALEFLNEND